MYILYRFLVRLHGFLWRNIFGHIVRFIICGDNLKVPRDAIFYGIPVIEIFPGSNILFGRSPVICSSSFFTPMGVKNRVVIKTFSAKALIEVGDDCGISGATICCYKKITIGKGVLLGSNVTIVDSDFHPVASLSRRYDDENVECSSVVIGDNVFVGAGVVVLKGVSIGDNSVIGAGSVVVCSIPANVIAAGNPCRIIRTIDFL